MKQLWTILATALVAVLWMTQSATAQQAEIPTVVIMLADNLGYGDVGVYAADEVHGMPTPNIDKLAAEDL